MPHIIVVFPTLTKAEPSAVDMEPEEKGKAEISGEKNKLYSASQRVFYLYSEWLVWILKALVHQVDSFLSREDKVKKH